MRYLKFLGHVMLALIIIVLSCNLIIRHTTSSFLYDKVEDISYNKAGLVLGTSKYTREGDINQFYLKRLEAARQLYEAGKIDCIIVSGDNRAANYNEPEMMRKDLIEMGIPQEKIYPDYAGFRTLDSMIRAKYIFGQYSYTVISQKFHNERAVFIARNRDINAIGFNAEEVRTSYGIRVYLRDMIAKVKVFIDLYSSKEPHFYGDFISIK